MKAIKSLFENEIKELGGFFHRQNLRTDDIYALNLLQPLMQGEPYLPFTNSGFRPLCLAHLLNDLVINRRRTILEFGSGISTILIGRLIRKNRLKAKVVSIDHMEEWADIVRQVIRNEQLEEFITIVHAPLKPCHLALGSNEWYDMEVLDACTAAMRPDMVIVDGPPAWEAPKKEARYPALPFIAGKLADRCVVFLDDADRNGEQSIIRKWEQDYGVKFWLTGGSLAYASRGDGLNPEIF